MVQILIAKGFFMNQNYPFDFFKIDQQEVGLAYAMAEGHNLGLLYKYEQI